MKTIKIIKEKETLYEGVESSITDIEYSLVETKHLPEVGTRVLALYKGEWIVLEMGEEIPTHEETFTSFKYWFEPFRDMIAIEYEDVYNWVDLPDKEEYL